MISVVVPTYNEEEHIETCLKALLDQTLPKSQYEIIVSDSSSTDNTVKLAKKLVDKVTVCKKVGAGFGRNWGASKAKGSILAFVDADSIPARGWLEAIKGALDSKDAVAVTGPFHSIEKESVLEQFFYRVWSTECHLTTVLGFPLLPGFNFAVKKNAFDQAGGFKNDDEVCEDFDLSLKLRREGQVKFDKDMEAATSARKLREMGIIKYSLHGLMFLLFKKKYTWADHRQDW